MPNLIRTTASIEPRDSGAFLAIENHTYPNEGTYILHPTGIYRSIVPNAVWKGYHTGDWDIYKANSGLTLDDTYVGSIIEFDSKKALDIQGNRFAKPNTIYTKKEQPYLYEYYSLTRPELIIDDNTFKTPRLSNHLRPTYNPDSIYNEGDILYIEPDTYAEQTFAAGTYKTHIGKNIVYQGTVTSRRYAVAVRSTKDNNTDNPVTYFGTSWVVDQPNDIIETGTCTINSTNKYTLRAGGEAYLHMKYTGTVADTGAVTLTNPFVFKNTFQNSKTVKAYVNAGSDVYQLIFNSGTSYLHVRNSNNTNNWVSWSGAMAGAKFITVEVNDEWY